MNIELVAVNAAGEALATAVVVTATVQDGATSQVFALDVYPKFSVARPGVIAKVLMVSPVGTHVMGGGAGVQVAMGCEVPLMCKGALITIVFGPESVWHRPVEAKNDSRVDQHRDA